MTTVCHNKTKNKNNLKIIVFVVVFCYNKIMSNLTSKHKTKYRYIVITLFISLSILTALLFSMINPNNSGKNIFADETAVQIQTDIDDIESFYHIDYFDGEIFLTAQNNVTVLNSNLESTSFESNDISTGFYKPKFALKTSKNSVFVFDELKRIQKFDAEFEHQKTYQYVKATDYYLLGNVADITKDYFGKLYFVDFENNKLLTIDNTDDFILELTVNFDFEFDQNSKIAVNPNGDLLAVFFDEKIMLFDMETLAVKKEIPASNVKNIKIDCLNNLFLIYENKIEKYDFDSFEKVDTINFDIQIKSCSLNIENGKFYVLSDKIYKFYSEGFSANATGGDAPVDISITTLNNEICEFARVKNKTKLFTTSVSFSSSDEIDENQIVVCLKKDIAENSQMCYCLANMNNEQKTGYVSKVDLEFLTLESNNEVFETVCKNVNIYTYPTKNAGIYSSIKNDDTIVIVLSDLGEYIDENDNKYYAVSTENGVGYVEQKYLAKMGNFESTKIETDDYNTYQKEFVSYIIIVTCLVLITVASCVFVAKKKK